MSSEEMPDLDVGVITITYDYETGDAEVNWGDIGVHFAAVLLDQATHLAYDRIPPMTVGGVDADEPDEPEEVV